jgi:NAD+--asparagine ADP-ribosyltransferase
VAVMDSKTSEICREHDEKEYDVSDATVGRNYPPLHPRCRSTTVQVVDWSWLEGEAKAADVVGPEQIEDKSKKFSDAEMAALLKYKSFESYVINLKLRNGEALTVDENEFVKTLDSALDKAPDYSGDLNRSLYFHDDEELNDFINQHKAGNIVKYNQYISTTKGDTYNPDGEVQIIIEDSKQGKDISGIGLNEDEILYKRGCEFFVKMIYYENEKHFIVLKENSHE